MLLQFRIARAFAAGLLCAASWFLPGAWANAASGVSHIAKGVAENVVDTAARWDTQFGSAIGCDGSVFDLEPLGGGLLLVVGSYISCGNADVVHVAAWDPALGRFQRLGGGSGNELNGVGALASLVTSTRIVVAGEFFEAGGQPVANVTVFDRATGAWSALGGPTSQGTNGRILALAIAGDTLFVGGEFTQAGGGAANRVAAYSFATGTWTALGEGVDGPVGALAVVDGVLFVGGSFASAGGAPAANLARWDPNAAAWLPTSGADGAIHALVAGDGGLHAGGAFRNIGGVAARRVARRLATGEWVPLGDGIGGPAEGDGEVRAVLPVSGGAWVAGEFSLAGSNVVANRVAQFTTATEAWQSLGSGTANGTSGRVLALAALGPDVFVGGQFARAGGAAANAVARFGVASRIWSPLGSGLSNGANAIVNALAGDGSSFFAGGIFGVAGGVTLPFIGRFGPAQGAWSALGGVGVGTSNPVRALALDGNALYVGGEFQSAGGNTSPGAARFDLASQSWSSLAGGVSGVVNAMLARPDGVVAGGTLTAAGGAPVRSLARFDRNAQSWFSVGSGPEGTNGTVLALAGAGNLLVVGGQYSEAGGTPASNIAAFDFGSNAWTALGSGTDGEVAALAIDDQYVYVGGSFAAAGGLPARNLARYHRATGAWSAVPGVGADGVNDRVRALALSGGALWVGGDFTRAGAGAAIRNRLLRIDLASGIAMPLGSESANGVGFYVNAVLPLGPDVYVAGAFGQAFSDSGQVRSLRIGRYDARRPALTTFSVSPSTSPRVNTMVQLSASVAVAGFPAVPGVVDFLDGGSVVPGCGAVALVGGGDLRTATCVTAQLPLGTRSISARYRGDADNFRGTSAVTSVTVQPPDFRLLPATLPGGTFGTPGFIAGPITVETGGTTGVVSPALQVVVDALQLPPGLAATQQAGGLVISGTPTQAGSFTFTVRATDSSAAAVGGPFSGDRQYTIVVAKAAQTITPITRVDSAPLDNGVALAAGDFGVQATATSGLPVVIDSTTPTVCQVGAPGFTVQPLVVGTCTLRARQAGNNDYEAAPDVLRSFQVKATPLVFIASAPSPSLWPLGQPQPDAVLLTATVEGSQPGGTVRFLRGANTIAGCSAQPVSTAGDVGTATCSTTSLQRGPNTLSAQYPGDARNVAETSNSITHELNVGTAVGIATITPNPCVVGQGCVVAVAVAAASGVPTGSVQVGSNTGGSCTVTLQSGGASCALTATTAGTGTVTATYLGTPPWLASPATTLAHPFVATVVELFINGFEPSAAPK
jgi:hypothetical protein